MVTLLATTLFLLVCFLVLSFFTFYLTGFGIIAFSKEKLAGQEIITISLCLGVVMFVLLAVLLGFLNLRFLILPLILLVDIIIIIKFRKNIFNPWSIFIKDKILLLFILLGILVQGFINFPSGFLYSDGLKFWSSQGHDGLWHVASMEQVKVSMPVLNPGFSGENIYNYHYLVDVLMGEFARIFPIFSSLDLYFRFFPVLFSFMMGISVFALMVRWKVKEAIGYLGLFFFYFTGSFGYIVNFINGGSIFGGETVFWAAQENTLLGNPPHAISHAIIVTFFLSVFLYLKSRSKYWFFVSFLIGCILAGFKVSGGLVMLVGLSALTFFDLIIYRKIGTLLLTTILGITNFITFKSLTSSEAASFLMFLPWWFVRTTIVDRLGWMDLELRRQHYLAQHTWHATLRVIQLEMTAFLLFVVGNLGMRIIGIWEMGRELFVYRLNLFKNLFEIMLFASMLTGLVVPLLFVQKGLIYNNIQFMQYFLLIFGFYAAISTYNILMLFKSIKLRIIMMSIIVIFSVPTVIGNLTELYGPERSPLAIIVPEELEALNYLKNNSSSGSVVLNVPFDPYLKNKFNKPPLPIYAWYDTSYTSAISERRSYLASEHVTLLAYPQTKERQENMQKFFSQEDFDWNRQLLKKEKINYIYLAKDQLKQPLDIIKNNLENFFENDKVIIYHVTDS